LFPLLRLRSRRFAICLFKLLASAFRSVGLLGLPIPVLLLLLLLPFRSQLTVFAALLTGPQSPPPDPVPLDGDESCDLYINRQQGKDGEEIRKAS